MGVADDGLLLEVADHPVCGRGREEVEEEIEIVEDRLSHHDHEAFE